MSVGEQIINIKEQLPPEVNLVAVSKFHPLEALLEAYEAGQRAFGENRPQELMAKAEALIAQGIKDVEWHFLGHLQTNKLKMVLPYVTLVQSIDTLHLLQEVDQWGARNGKVLDVLLELHIGAEETKQGFVEEDILDIMFRAGSFKNIRFRGLMGMASHTDCEEDIRADFTRIKSFMDYLRDLFPEYADFDQLSIGMSGDWKIALDYGATMVRIGTAIFGERIY